MVLDAKSSDERLAKFRDLLAKADKGKGVDAYIIPTEDPHMVHPVSVWCKFSCNAQAPYQFWHRLCRRIKKMS